jgi:hypothetical protein
VALEGGLAIGQRTGVVGLELGAWFADWLHASFQPQLLLPSVGETIRDDSGVRGSAEVLELPFRFAFGVGRTTERWAWHVGPALRLSLRRASTSDLVIAAGDEYKSGDSSATGWAVAGGASAGATYWLRPAVGITASLALDVQISETDFRIQDSRAGRILLVSPSPQGQALLGVAFGARP